MQMESVTVTYSGAKDSEGQLVDAGGKEIALFRIDGTFYAIENRCPHRGGPLSDGFLRDKSVTCPLHGWSFDVTTGSSPNRSDQKIGCFPVSAVGNEVTITLSPR